MNKNFNQIKYHLTVIKLLVYNDNNASLQVILYNLYLLWDEEQTDFR